GVTKAGGLAEAKYLSDAVHRPLLLIEQRLGTLETQFVEQALVARAQFLQVATQRARRAMHLLRQILQPGRLGQLRGEQLTHSLQPGLAAAELGIQATTALHHIAMGNAVSQWQAALQQGRGKSEGIALCGKTQWTGEPMHI